MPRIDLAKFGDNALDVLKNGNLFDETSLVFLNKTLETSADIWKRTQRGRTETELRFSVLNDLMFPTPDSKYWQVYREANAQFESLVFASYDWQESQADIEILECEIEDLKSQEMGEKMRQALIRKKEIAIERKKMRMMGEKASAEDRVRELHILYALRDELKKDLKYGTSNPDTHQLVSYAQSLTMRVDQARKSGMASASEINNLTGTRDMCIKEIAKDDETLNAFMSGLPQVFQDSIAQEFNFNRIEIRTDRSSTSPV